MRKIDGDALELDSGWDGYEDGFTAYSRGQILDAPTIEAELVRHGQWEECGIGGTVKCSECQFTDFFAKRDRVMLFGYCPGCGAKMEGPKPQSVTKHRTHTLYTEAGRVNVIEADEPEFYGLHEAGVPFEENEQEAQA